MNPVVEGALIGGTVAAVVAVAGYRAAVRTTRMALDAARSDRRWDRKAAAYHDAIAYLSDRRAKRQAYLRAGRAREDKDGLGEYFASYNAPRWFDVSAALLTFATPDVLDALLEANSADSRARRAYEQWKHDDELKQRHDQIEGAPGREAEATFVMEALATFQAQLREAETSEDALMEAMRDDLHKNPSDDHPAPRPGSCRGVLPPDPL